MTRATATLMLVAGAATWLPIERVTNSAQTLRRLKEEGFWVYGAAAGGVAPWDLDLRGKVALCFGGEQQGLRQLTRELCDGLIGLPMRGHVESLNLATAGAVAPSRRGTACAAPSTEPSFFKRSTSIRVAAAAPIRVVGSQVTVTSSFSTIR